MISPYLRFDFPKPLCFQDPLHVITAYSPAEVRPALCAVQDATDAGYFAAGFVAYEAAPAFDPAMQVRVSDAIWPLVWFGVFSAPYLPNDIQQAEAFHVGVWEAEGNYSGYQSAIENIRERIAAGDVYQVNHTFRLSATFRGDALSLYRRLRGNGPPAYSAYLEIGNTVLLSASPELFFQRLGNHIVTRPMKGTRARGRWHEEDEQLARDLKESLKDRAENVMIVDLLRNDLGRIAVPGSVNATRLFDIEQYPTVWQMTSTIEAQLPPRINLDDIFAALFPCGSVTGAPKISATHIIAAGEKSPRDVYCGAIGYLTPQGEAVFSVAIRTAWLDKALGTVNYGVGGGIVWDSTPEDEYREAWAKAAILTEPPPKFDLLETLLWKNGKYALLDRHLARLTDSAAYFGFSVSETQVREKLIAHSDQLEQGEWRVRLCVSSEGIASIESALLAPLPPGALPIAIANTPVSRGNKFLCHKTTNRAVYESHRQQHPHCFDVLLWNEDKELTEFTIGNVVIETEGRWWTPPRSAGLLNGTKRAELLDLGQIHERILHPNDLETASQIWLVNSVRGFVPVRLVSEWPRNT